MHDKMTRPTSTSPYMEIATIKNNPQILDIDKQDVRNDYILTWRNLTVTKRRKLLGRFWSRAQTEQVKILNDVTGAVKSGNLLAIMGASGAGKTTMLATISGRDSKGCVGSLLLNGIPVTSTDMVKCSGFAPQFDLCFEELTLVEHMTFMAKLKMNRTLLWSIRERTIRKLLKSFGIAACADAPLKTLSGGERKRVTICVELLNNPEILFCDEPTTGLDSWAAVSTVKMLRQLAESGKIVVSTIHQPASGIFNLFHDVVLLANGKVAYHGPSSEAASFFAGLNLRCPIGFNQAEYYITQLSIANGKEKECMTRMQNICFEYTVSKYSENIQSLITKSENTPIPSEESKGIVHHESNIQKRQLRKPGWFMQFFWLTWRLYIVTKRSIYTFALDFVLFMMIAFLVAVPYINVTQSKDQQDIQNVEGLMYLTITETVFLHIYQVLTIFPLEISILLRESAGGLYRSSAYYCSKMLLLIPIALVNSLFYTIIIFYVTGLEGGFIGFVQFFLPVVITSIASSAYGAALSASFESINTAVLVSVPLEIIGLTFSGIFLSIPSASIYVMWMKYISIFYYGIEAISVLQWQNVEHIECSTVKNVKCIQNGTQVLEKYGFSADSFYFDYIALGFIYLICHLIGMLMIFRRSQRQAVY